MTRTAYNASQEIGACDPLLFWDPANLCQGDCTKADFDRRRAVELKHGRSAFTPMSGQKKQHKHKLFGPDFPRTFLTLTPECPGVKKFLPTTGAAGKRTFWCGRPRFSARTSMTQRVVEKLCTKKVCVDFWVPTIWRRLRGNRNRGNRPERFREGNLPLRGSLRGPLRGRVFRGS